MTRKSSRQRRPETYRQRFYRHRHQAAGLVPFRVQVKETDLDILANRVLDTLAYETVLTCRSQLETYLAAHPRFRDSLVPLPPDPLAPVVVREMLAAGCHVGVGPMAAVAGALAEQVGRRLLAEPGVAEVIVENGGDIFLCRCSESVIGIFAGDSPLSNRLGIRIAAHRTPLGVCTSSGTVGHSLSLGKADSVTVIARSTALADAAATGLGNEVRRQGGVERALARARELEGLAGVVVIRGEQLGAWGEVELVGLD